MFQLELDESISEQIDLTSLDGPWHLGRPLLGRRESIAFRLADELHETSTVSDDLWEELTARFDDAQVLELLITAGWYHVIGFVCNAAAVEHEEWAERFPPALHPDPRNLGDDRHEVRPLW